MAEKNEVIEPKIIKNNTKDIAMIIKSANTQFFLLGFSSLLVNQTIIIIMFTISIAINKKVTSLPTHFVS